MIRPFCSFSFESSTIRQAKPSTRVAAAAAAQTSGAAAAQQLRNTLFASDSVVDAAIKKQNDDA